MAVHSEREGERGGRCDEAEEEEGESASGAGRVAGRERVAAVGGQA